MTLNEARQSVATMPRPDVVRLSRDRGANLNMAIAAIERLSDEPAARARAAKPPAFPFDVAALEAEGARIASRSNGRETDNPRRRR